MNPFYVFDLSVEATDAEVEARYIQLIRENPPDRAPDVFTLIQKAYDALKTEKQRWITHQRYFDKSGRALTEEAWWLPLPLRRRRLSPDEMRALLQRPPQGTEP